MLTNRQKRKISLELIFCGLIMIGVYTVFNLFVGLAIIHGSSMNPTLQDGSVIIMNKQTTNLEYGDIVIINENVYGKELIKRVIGKEGDIIDIDFETGIVTRNGTPLDEPYTNTPTNKGYDVKFPITVEKDCIFVMGDNRNDSVDSRSSQVGCIPLTCIEGVYLWTIRK